MYRKVIIPDKNNHSIEMPEKFFGKKVIITVVELDADLKIKKHPKPPVGKKVSISRLMENFGADPDFPSIEEIRSKAWPSKW